MVEITTLKMFVPALKVCWLTVLKTRLKHHFICDYNQWILDGCWTNKKLPTCIKRTRFICRVDRKIYPLVVQELLQHFEVLWGARQLIRNIFITLRPAASNQSFLLTKSWTLATWVKTSGALDHVGQWRWHCSSSLKHQAGNIFPKWPIWVSLVMG